MGHLDDTSARANRGGVGSDGYLLDQSPPLNRIDLTDRRQAQPGGPPRHGAHRTKQALVADLAGLTGPNLWPLPAADRLPAQPMPNHPRADGDGPEAVSAPSPPSDQAL